MAKLRSINSSMSKNFLLLFFLVFLTSCSSTLEREIAVPGTYNRVFISSVDAALGAGFGITEADREEGRILGEDVGDTAKYDLEIYLEERGYDVLITFSVYAKQEDDRNRTFLKFVQSLKMDHKNTRVVSDD